MKLLKKGIIIHNIDIYRSINSSNTARGNTKVYNIIKIFYNIMFTHNIVSRKITKFVTKRNIILNTNLEK